MKSFYTARAGALRLALAIAFVVLLALVPFTALAAGDLPPSPTWSDLMNATVTQGLAWLIAFGISAGVTYVLGQFPQLDLKVKGAIGLVVTAMLVAGVTALGSLIPQQWMDKTLWEAAIALMTLIVNAAGGFAGSLKGQEHYLARVVVKQKIETLAVFGITFLLGSALTLAPAPAFADGPQPVQYAIVHCSGLPISQVVSGQRQFDDQYGADHQLTASAQWEGTYVARVNEFAATVGCPRVLNDDGSRVGVLTLYSNIFAPTFRHILERNLPQ